MMSRIAEPKQALFEQLAVIAHALGSAARLKLLDVLAQGESNVEGLAQAPVFPWQMEEFGVRVTINPELLL